MVPKHRANTTAPSTELDARRCCPSCRSWHSGRRAGGQIQGTCWGHGARHKAARATCLCCAKHSGQRARAQGRSPATSRLLGTVCCTPSASSRPPGSDGTGAASWRPHVPTAGRERQLLSVFLKSTGSMAGDCLLHKHLANLSPLPEPILMQGNAFLARSSLSKANFVL